VEAPDLSSSFQPPNYLIVIGTSYIDEVFALQVPLLVGRDYWKAHLVGIKTVTYDGVHDGILVRTPRQWLKSFRGTLGRLARGKARVRDQAVIGLRVGSTAEDEAPRRLLDWLVDRTRRSTESGGLSAADLIQLAALAVQQMGGAASSPSRLDAYRSEGGFDWPPRPVDIGFAALTD
jgi:hypothetical protein